MLLIILIMFGLTMYVYYTTLWPKGLTREFIASAVLITLVAGLYGALALGFEVPPINTFVRQLVQGLVKR